MNKNLVSVLLVGLLVIVLGALYGPRVVRGYHFRTAATDMMLSIKSGQVSKAMAWVDKSQRQQAEEITLAGLGPDYHTSIKSLKLTDTRWLDNTTMFATVTCKLDYGGANPIYQGKLLWRFDNGVWVWDFMGSYLGEYAGLEEPTWVKLDEMSALVENY